MGNEIKQQNKNKHQKLGDYKVSPILLVVITGIITILTSTIQTSYESKQEQKNIDYEHESDIVYEQTRTQIQADYLTSVPTSTSTPCPTVTPQAILEYVIVKQEIMFLGETHWHPTSPGYEDSTYLWTMNTENPEEENIALWCPNIPQDGLYRIEVFIPNKDLSVDDNIRTGELSQKALYQVVVVNENSNNQIDYSDIEEVITTIEFNQELNSDGSWHQLGDFTYNYYKDEKMPCIKLGDKTGEVPTRIILFDAVRWVYIGNY